MLLIMHTEQYSGTTSIDRNMRSKFRSHILFTRGGVSPLQVNNTLRRPLSLRILGPKDKRASI